MRAPRVRLVCAFVAAFLALVLAVAVADLPSAPPGQKAAAEAGLQVFPAANDFKGRALVDLGALDDDWPAIAQTLAGLVPADLNPAALRTVGITDPLIAGLRAMPAVAIVGSCRQFSDAESIVLTEYLRAGGRALILVRASDPNVMRIVSVNGLMLGLDVTAILGRGPGAVEVTDHPAVAGLKNLGTAPAGVRLMAPQAEKLASAGGVTIAVAATEGQGRYAVVDASALSVADPKDAKAVAARDAYAKLVQSCLAWVTAK